MITPEGLAYVTRLISDGHDQLTEQDHAEGIAHLDTDELGVAAFRFGQAHARLLGEFRRRTGQAPEPREAFTVEARDDGIGHFAVAMLVVGVLVAFVAIVLIAGAS